LPRDGIYWTGDNGIFDHCFVIACIVYYARESIRVELEIFSSSYCNTSTTSDAGAVYVRFFEYSIESTNF
jgi:hypothetical protein